MVRLSLLFLVGLLAGCAPLQERAESPRPLPLAPANTIFVSQGETVYTVAQRYGVPVRDLIEANRLVPPYRLSPGQRLSLPVPQTYFVKAGDTLYGISRQYGLDLSELVRLNGIRAPYAIQVGQTLKLPAGPASGRAVAQPAQGASRTVAQADPPRPSPSPGMQSEELPPLPGTQGGQGGGGAVVQPDGRAPTSPTSRTGSRIAPAVGLSREMQGSGPPPASAPATRVPGGMAVEALPPLAGQAEAPAAAPVVPSAEQVGPQSPAAPASQAEERQIAAVPAIPRTVPDDARIAPRGGRFLWPVTGPILSEFGPKDGGLHNDGINIGAPRGTPVVAADGGEVAYSGNELRGFGNLLLIRHADGWVTAYAHLDTVLVERGHTVKRGDKIGTVGQTGNVRSPQLHFEIRRGSRAIDPREHLDGGRQTSERR